MAYVIIIFLRSDVNNTCPICRNEIHGNKDYWELPEAPSKGEIGQFVMGMAESAGNPSWYYPGWLEESDTVILHSRVEYWPHFYGCWWYV